MTKSPKSTREANLGASATPEQPKQPVGKQAANSEAGTREDTLRQILGIHPGMYTQRMEEIMALLQQVEVEARVDELRKLVKDTLSPENFGGRFIHEPVTEFANQQSVWIDDRINELKALSTSKEDYGDSK